MNPHNSGQHLESDKNKDERQPFLQMMKSVQKVLHEKENRPQSHDGEYVRRVDYKRMLGDGKCRGNGIHRENNICRFNENQDHKKRREVPFAILMRNKFSIMMVGAEPQILARQTEHFVVAEIHMLFFFVFEKFNPRIQEHYSENVQHPIKLAHNRRPHRDKNGPKKYGSQNSPKKNSMVVLLFQIEKTEDQHEDKKVIHRQHFLHEVRTDEFRRHLRPQKNKNQNSKNERHRHPKNPLNERRARTDAVRLSIEIAEVKDEKPPDNDGEEKPEIILCGHEYKSMI